MATVIEPLLRVSLRLITNNILDKETENSNKHNVAGKTFQNVIIREINGVKSKLDGSERKKLISIINNFEKGLIFIYQLVEKRRSENLPLGKNGTLDRLPLSIEEAEIVVTVTDRLRKLDMAGLHDCTEELICESRSSFKASREEATRIFSNESLRLSERLLALKFGVMAILLECLDNLEDALEACKWYIEELHAIPAVQEAFKLQIYPRLHAGEQERLDIIHAVCLVNHVIFNVTQIIEEEKCCLFPWPQIDIGEESIDPLRDERVVGNFRKKSMSYCDVTWSFGQEGRPGTKLQGPFDVATNSIGLFIVADCNGRDIKVFNNSGKYLFSFSPPNIDKNTERFIPISVAADKHDNVFVLARLKERYGSTEWHGVYVFDSNYKVDNKFGLREGFRGWALTANEDNQVFILGGYEKEPQVFVYTSDGHFVQSFGEGLLAGACDIAAAGRDCVMILESRNHAVHLFNSKGKELQMFKLQGSVYPAGCLTFNQMNNLTVIASKNRFSRRGQIEMYTKHGEFVRVIQLDTERDVYFLGATVTSESYIAVVNWSQDRVNIVQPGI